MPQLPFDKVTQSLQRLPQFIQSIPDIVRNPAANPLQAAILLSMAVLVLLVVLLSVVLTIMRPDLEDAELYGEAAPGEAGTGARASASLQVRAMSWLTAMPWLTAASRSRPMS